MFPRTPSRPLRGPQAVVAMMVLAVAFWGSVAFLVSLRSEVAEDPDFLIPEEEAEESPLDRQPLEPFEPDGRSYPRVLGLAYGTPPVVLTDARSGLHLCDTREPRITRNLHLIRPPSDEQ